MLLISEEQRACEVDFFVLNCYILSNLSLPRLVSFVILFTVCHTILVMLVLRFWYWVNK